jgi:methionyl-tRNA formyltransferase
MSAAAPERLRVLFITEDDPMYVLRFFESFFAQMPADEFDIVGITVSRAFHEPLLKTARRMWRFYGPVDFFRLCGRFVLAKLRRASIGALASAHGVPEIPTTSVNDPAYLQRIAALKPDVIVSVAAPEIFREGILNSARLRCINIHSGRLPRYRGMMPNFWQLLHGEAHATITVHEMAAKLDAGRVIATLDFPLQQHDSLDRVITETKRAGASLMIDVLRHIRSGTDRPQELDMTSAGYFRFPGPEDVRAFRKRGHRML